MIKRNHVETKRLKNLLSLAQEKNLNIDVSSEEKEPVDGEHANCK